MIINNSVNVLKPDMEKVPFVWYIVLYVQFSAVPFASACTWWEHICQIGNCANSQLFILRDHTPYREHSNIGIHGNRGV